MVWYRGLAEEVTKDSPLSETTGVDERKPTLKDKGMRRPDDHEANSSGPLHFRASSQMSYLPYDDGGLGACATPAQPAHWPPDRVAEST